MIANKNILITEGDSSGSRTLVRRFLERDPTVIRILDQSVLELGALKPDLDHDRCRF
mgnify:CR=1 FL=1